MNARRDWILHVDLDQFVAAVEILRRPELKGKPVVVGGSEDPTKRRVVVSTASYEARAFGIHSGMPLRAAVKRCPDAVFIRADHEAYREASERVMAVLRTFGPVELLGWDEAFVGATTASPEGLAEKIRTTVLDETGLSCAVGIGDNKHRAKLATGFAKPAGQYRLTAENWESMMFERPVTALWGIGSKMSANLAELGITTVAELAAVDSEELSSRFGETMGPRYRDLARGVGDTILETRPRVARSNSSERTFETDLTDHNDITEHVLNLAKKRAHAAKEAGRPVVRVAVKLRFTPYFTKIRSRTLAEPTNDMSTIEQAALIALERFDDERPVRLVGVRLDFL